MIDIDLYFDDFLLEQELINEAVKNDVSKVESQIIRMYNHLLKFEYQPERQDRSWYDSIFGAYSEIIKYKNNNNVMNRIDLDECYIEGRRKASSETGLDESIFPYKRPTKWDINFITNIDSIIDHIKHAHNKNATYNVDFDEYINYKLNKLQKRK